MVRKPLRRCVAACALLFLLSGCSTLLRNPIPPELMAEATIPGMPEVRAWAGRPSAVMERDLALSFEQESAADFPRGTDGVVRYPHLAISGGGANGAFGAGLLNGWTATGKRPVFKIVTGVSTGALIAPFAFLGPSYDDAIRDFYTTTSTRDVLIIGSLLRRLITADSLASAGPLAATIEKQIDADFLRKVADEHGRGRRLYIGTANLDAQQFVVWNMGLIAASGHSDALDLFRRIMLASASIPIAFPPVMFDVQAAGARFDEMHVDGGIGARVFVSGGVFRPSIIRERTGRGLGREDIYVIHNGQLREEPTPVPRSMIGIAGRVLEATSRSAVVGDLYRIWAFTVRENADYQWVTIPSAFSLTSAELFDPVQMTKLYQLGFQLALSGPPWSVYPPGWNQEQEPAP